MAIDNLTMAEVCAGGLILLILVIVAYLLFGSKPITYSKRAGPNKTDLAVTAKRNLRKISVIAKFDDETINFERNRIRKGQTVDFEYPSSKVRATLIVEEESGKQKTYEI